MKRNMKMRNRLVLRTSQKQTLRFIIAAGSVIVLATITSVYIIISQSGMSKENNIKPYNSTYTTTDANVPVRLILKNIAREDNTNSSDTNAQDSINNSRYGRSMPVIINPDSDEQQK